MPDTPHAIARRFFAGLSAGAIPEDLLTDDMTGWTTSSGAKQERARYAGGVAMLATLFDGGLRYTVDSLTAEDDRVAAEVRAEGTFRDGERFANSYVFILRLRDGRIAAVAEHFDPTPVREKIVPRITALMAKG